MNTNNKLKELFKTIKGELYKNTILGIFEGWEVDDNNNQWRFLYKNEYLYSYSNAHEYWDYHESYDSLMRIWFKFRELRFESLKHEKQHYEYKSKIGLSLVVDNDISKPYNLLVEAIEWYNSTLK